MVRYVLDIENKKIELLSSGTMEELKDLYELYKDYEFIITPQIQSSKQGMTVGAAYVNIVGRIEHS